MTENEAAPGQEAPVVDDVHADVRAAVEALSKTDNAETATDDAPKERVRDESGKFTKADGAHAGDVPKDITDHKDLSQDKPEPHSPAVEPPKGWSADAKAKWSSLDPSIQAEIAKREQDMDTGGQRWSEEKRRYEETITPMRDFAKVNGIDEKEAITRFLNADQFLQRDPVNAIKWLADSYGVDLQNMTASPRPQPDPLSTQLYQTVQTLEQRWAAHEAQQARAQIEAFKGSHEHFEDVREQMGRLMESGQAASLDEAYDKAVWLNPSVREKLIAAQTAQASQTRKTQDQVNKAKRGAISVNGSPVGQAPPSQKREFDTVEEATRAAWAQHMGA